MDATPFDREAGYWLQKQGLPERLAAAVAPWLDRGLSALDLGCGGGRIAVALRQRMARVVGVDAAKELVEQAAAAHPEVRFVHGDCLLDATWRALGFGANRPVLKRGGGSSGGGGGGGGGAAACADCSQTGCREASES